jgi:hypothetical protein
MVGYRWQRICLPFAIRFRCPGLLPHLDLLDRHASLYVFCFCIFWLSLSVPLVCACSQQSPLQTWASLPWTSSSPPCGSSSVATWRTRM